MEANDENSFSKQIHVVAREQAGLSLLHVSSAWPHGNLIFRNLLKTAISIYGEMQTGVEGAADRGRVKACCAPCPGHDGEKTPVKWLARNPLVPLCTWAGHFKVRAQQTCLPDNTTDVDGGLYGEGAFTMPMHT